MIQLGLRLHDSHKLPIENLLPRVKESGFSCVHLALRKVLENLPCTPSSLTPGYASYLKKLFERNGLDIAVLGNYLNLAHPSDEVIRNSIESYYAHIRFASLLGCGIVGTETGAPNIEYKFSEECRTDKAFSTFLKNFRPIVKCAEQYGVTIAIEPVVRHIVWSSKRCRQVLDEIGSHNLKVIFDPVNLLELDNVDRRDEVIHEAIELLAPDIAMIHLKDYIRVNEGHGLKSVGAGTGEMDYARIMSFIKKEKPYIYATLENTTVENEIYCRDTILRAYADA
ncbi:sugar phosphate isomerase/epimerase family protein [Proteiniclasticum ruminis]|uniref:Sugar phosphate isomerase/epimerase n=1 Tax=Proteiniclasticum ruminis TaxID=398199 RepID=A0A1G8HNF7_9CLOT|nr:sugar phosphate isomerase/epimerase family protein [Proteiniclasticum ruminis]SDI08020.1 Sugar phosphate isomerase/epimerase [Proteiniclasticum ruminis]